MIRAGDLDRTIVIERVSQTVAPSGSVVETWEEIATMRAKLSQITTSDMLRDTGGLTSAFTIFRTRWCERVSVADRIRYGSPLAIKSIREIGRREGLEITCEALQ